MVTNSLLSNLKYKKNSTDISLLNFPTPNDLIIYNIWGIQINHLKQLIYPIYDKDTYTKGLHFYVRSLEKHNLTPILYIVLF